MCLTPSDPEYKIWCSEQWRAIIRKDVKAKKGNNENTKRLRTEYDERCV
jgi:hypothetical protein